MFPGDSYHDDGGSASLGDVRRAWLCLFLGILSSFDTGNWECGKHKHLQPQYDLLLHYCVLFLCQGALLVLKMAVPFVFSEYYVKCHPLIAQQTSQVPGAGHV